MNYNLLNFCEFDNQATKSYCAIHGVDESLNLGDITQIDVDSLPSEGVDLITHGSPCFTAETLVMTNKGYKKIIDIKAGDMVLDHTLNYSKVVNTFEQGEKEIWRLELGTGEYDSFFSSVRTTSNHKFYTKHKETGIVDWIECKELNSAYLVGTADIGATEIKWQEIFAVINTCSSEQVYDIEVENTHSFTANGIIAHNCQSFSIAGTQHGGEKGSGTRSSLLWNSVEIIRHCKPKFVIWENVKNVLSAKHKPVFDAYVDEMKNMHYNTYYGILNAKNYGIPQNRERIYAISVREDIDNNPDYDAHINHNKYYDKSSCSLFPTPFDDGLRLKDFLEPNVDERFYLNDEYVRRFKESRKSGKYPFGNEYKVLGTTVGTGQGTNSRHWVYDANDNVSTLDATMYKQPKQILVDANKPMQLGDISPEGKNSIYARIYATEGCSPTIKTPTGGHTMPKIAEFDDDFRLRKLTPRECFRLMGFSDEDFDKAASTGNSNTALYKQAGNSIVVNVLVEIYKRLQIAYPNDFTAGMNVISLFSGIGAFEKALDRM